jgi:hypothetical protein
MCLLVLASLHEEEEGHLRLIKSKQASKQGVEAKPEDVKGASDVSAQSGARETGLSRASSV